LHELIKPNFEGNTVEASAVDVAAHSVRSLPASYGTAKQELAAVPSTASPRNSSAVVTSSSLPPCCRTTDECARVKAAPVQLASLFWRSARNGSNGLPIFIATFNQPAKKPPQRLTRFNSVFGVMKLAVIEHVGDRCAITSRKLLHFHSADSKITVVLWLSPKPNVLFHGDKTTPALGLLSEVEALNPAWSSVKWLMVGTMSCRTAITHGSRGRPSKWPVILSS
jgi:hypothetical protein